jgi:hypothetical protein
VSADDDRLAQELADQLRSLRVEDVVINALVQLSSVGYGRLGLTDDTRASRDLEQVRLAIETMLALVPVLEQAIDPELVRDFHSAVANLQLAYATAAGQQQAAGAGDAPADEAGNEAEEAGSGEPEAEEAG